MLSSVGNSRTDKQAIGRTDLARSTGGAIEALNFGHFDSRTDSLLAWLSMISPVSQLAVCTVPGRARLGVAWRKGDGTKLIDGQRAASIMATYLLAACCAVRQLIQREWIVLFISMRMDRMNGSYCLLWLLLLLLFKRVAVD